MTDVTAESAHITQAAKRLIDDYGLPAEDLELICRKLAETERSLASSWGVEPEEAREQAPQVLELAMAIRDRHQVSSADAIAIMRAELPVPGSVEAVRDRMREIVEAARRRLTR